MGGILIVEDEARIARFVELELTHEGYEVETASDGRAGVEAALSRDHDLILLDVMLPGLSGMEALRRIRRRRDVPIIMLTARDTVMDKVAGLDAGADDYVTKPFAIEELLARIRVALKRHGHGAHDAGGEADALTAGSVTLDAERHEVSVAGERVELTSREFALLKSLLEHKNRVMGRDQLAREALGYELVGDTNVVDVHVRHLRSKIDERYGVRTIETVRGVGYVIREA